MFNKETMRRFWTKVDSRGDCWLWTGGQRGNGYGCFKVNGKVLSAHRVSWVIKHGEIPTGKLILHKCNNRSCVNPKHLYVGTHKDNVADAIRAGTHYFAKKSYFNTNSARKGTENGSSKLDNIKVRDIRMLRKEGMGCRELGRLYSVDHSIISEVVNHKIWKHVT